MYDKCPPRKLMFNTRHANVRGFVAPRDQLCGVELPSQAGLGIRLENRVDFRCNMSTSEAFPNMRKKYSLSEKTAKK